MTSFRATCLCLLIALLGMNPLLARHWTHDGGMRWSAELFGWTLVVDASRGRLVEARSPGGDNVLLAGGHRAWLGPQAEWPKFWPPPADWERSPAAAVELREDGRLLVLEMPQTDASLPALTRYYRLRGATLNLGLGWRDPRRAWQAIHILQVRTDAATTLVPERTAAAPRGYGLLALANRPGTLLDAPPPPHLRLPSDPGILTASVAFTGTEEKLGFAPQLLSVSFPDGAGFSLGPAQVERARVVKPVPEAGLVSQVYLGSEAWPLIEVEQLSPRLSPLPLRGAPIVWVEFAPWLAL